MYAFFYLYHGSRPHISLVKAYLRRHGLRIREDENPEMALMEACGCVTAEKSRGWFHHAGYIWNGL